MASGTSFGGRCYATSQQAVDAYFASIAPDVVSGETSYMTEFVLDSGVWKSRSYTRSGGDPWSLQSSVVVPLPVLPSCDSDGELFLDGQVVGWGLAALMVAAWSYRVIREQAK